MTRFRFPNGYEASATKQAIFGGRETYLLTTGEAARALGVHVNTVRQWAKAGRLTEYKTAGHQAQGLYTVRNVAAVAEEEARKRDRA